MPLCISVIASGISLPVGVDGLRLCFVRYEDDPADRGNGGRVSTAGNVKLGAAWYWTYDGVRLGVGVDCFDVAGESCDGGVYGMLSSLQSVAGRITETSRNT